jgi:hypothetical protein
MRRRGRAEWSFGVGTRPFTYQRRSICTDVPVGYLVVNGAPNDHSVVVGVRQPASAFRLITVVGVARRLAHMHVERVSSSKSRSRLSA